MNDSGLVISRVFDAPRSLVWKAWTDAGRIAAWWGPSGFGNTVKSMDVRTGGQRLFTMHGPDGVAYHNKIFYNEVTVPELLDYHHGEEGEPSYFHVTVRFTEHDARTDMAYRMVFPTAEGKRMAMEQYGAAEGLEQTMTRLEAFLAKSGLLLTRVFDAPRSAVWSAWTEPAKMRKWWGPEHFTCPGAEIDLRVGGAYLLGMRSADGREFWSTGIYREIVSQEKLLYTDSFSDAAGKIIPAASLGLPGHWPDVQTVTVTFADLGTEKTLLTVHQESQPMEWHDMTSSGWSSSFDKLARLLAASQ
jgi:uncharacterized protein YndB with AHSA1/START domain